MFERLPPSRRFVVQIFVFIAFVCGAFFVISNKISNFGSKNYIIYFDRSISGLRIGNGVYFKGVPIGVVDSIKVDLPKAQRIAVVVKIDKEMPIYNSFVAKIGMQGLTGNSIIELANKNNISHPMILDGHVPEIKSEHSMIERLFEDIPHLVSNTKDLVKSIDEIIKKNNGDINLSIKNFAKALESLNKAFENISGSAKVFNRCANRFEVGVLPNAEIATENFAQLMKNVNRDWDVFSKGSMLQMIDLINNLNNLSNNVNQMMESERSYFGYLLGL